MVLWLYSLGAEAPGVVKKGVLSISQVFGGRADEITGDGFFFGIRGSSGWE